MKPSSVYGRGECYVSMTLMRTLTFDLEDWRTNDGCKTNAESTEMGRRRVVDEMKVHEQRGLARLDLKGDLVKLSLRAPGEGLLKPATVDFLDLVFQVELSKSKPHFWFPVICLVLSSPQTIV